MSALEYTFNDAPVTRYIEENGHGSKLRLCKSVGASAKWLEKLRKRGNLPTGRLLFTLADVLQIPVEELVIRKPKKPRR